MPRHLSLAGIRYAIVGGLCALLHNTIVIGFNAVGQPYTIAIFVSFVVVSIFGYLLHCRFTFRVSPSFFGFLRYSAALTINVPFLLVSMWLFTHAGVSVPIASILSTCCMFLVNFFVLRLVILWGHAKPQNSTRNDSINPNILLVTHYYAGHGGGIEIVAGELARRIGPRLPICWMASGIPSDPSLGVTIVPLGAWNGIERKLGLPLPIPGPRSAWRLARAAAEARAVWVHDLLYPSNLLAALVALLFGRPLFVTIHVGAIPYRNRALASLMRRSLHLSGHLFLPRATGVVFISERVRDEFATWIKLPQARLVPNGVDTTVFSPVDPFRRSKLRGELGLDARPAILFVGRFVERKGLPLLHELVIARSDLQWLFAGAGPLDPGAWKIPGVSVFRGRRGSSLAQIYQAADLLVLPSLGEGFPLVVAEALACGLPVLVDPSTMAGYAASSRVIAAESVGGSDAVARWLTRIDALIDAPDRDSESAKRVSFARIHWDWNACAAQYDALIESLDTGVLVVAS